MRIISGSLKGRQLTSVRGRHTRPTSDRTREALFNILGPGTINDTVILDLFAGTGALGIEALSRGARRAVFVDRDRQALNTLRRNIERCHLESATRIYQWDITKNLSCLNPIQQPFDLIFLDPPYHQNLILPALSHLIRLRALAPSAIVVAEHASKEIILPPHGLTVTDQRTYGRTALTFLTPPASTSEAPQPPPLASLTLKPSGFCSAGGEIKRLTVTELN